jgi:two-component system response regulator
MNSKIILLVEDNTDDAMLTLDAVEHSRVPAHVVVAENGAAALDYLYCSGPYAERDPRHDPVLVLLDLKLPKLDGHEVLRRIRSHPRTRLLPVVILTTSKEPLDVSACYEAGANSYIRKPVDYDQFLDAVRTIGAYWLGLNKTPGQLPGH